MANSSKKAGAVKASKASRQNRAALVIKSKGHVINSKGAIEYKELDSKATIIHAGMSGSGEELDEHCRKMMRYGVKVQSVRPRIRPVKAMDLSDLSGRVIVESATNKALRAHKNTFKKLADM